MKEIKHDRNRWRDIPCSWVGRTNIVKMAILTNTIYRFNAIPTKLPKAFFTVRTKNFTIRMEMQRPWIAKAVLRKKNGALGINLLDFRFYYKDTCIKTAWYWHKIRNIDHWNKLENPEINQWTYWYLSFYKEGKNIQWGKHSLFNKRCLENWTSMCKEWN